MSTETTTTPTPAEVVPTDLTKETPVQTPDPAPLNLDEPAPAPATPAVVPDAEPVVYDTTGDAALDVALDFIGSRGIAPDDPVMKAAEGGDFAPLRAKLAAMGDKAKGFEKFVALGEKSYAAVDASRKEAAEGLRKTVEAAAGGAESWQAVQAWASANATPEQKTQINAAIQAGGLAAASVVEKLTAMYQRSPEFTKTAPSARKPNAASPSSADPSTLSPKDYTKAVRELRSKVRGPIDNHPEYRALQERAARHRG